MDTAPWCGSGMSWKYRSGDRHGGPAENYGHFPDFGKWFLSFIMLLGRLELFTILILFLPSFWRK
jgi:Trk-type K+ transport system membrane component